MNSALHQQFLGPRGPDFHRFAVRSAFIRILRIFPFTLMLNFPSGTKCFTTLAIVKNIGTKLLQHWQLPGKSFFLGNIGNSQKKKKKKSMWNIFEVGQKAKIFITIFLHITLFIIRFGSDWITTVGGVAFCNVARLESRVKEMENIESLEKSRKMVWIYVG